jgi:hypothetical protein
MLRILEIAWLWIAIVFFGIAVFQYFSDGFRESLFMMIATLIAAMMYWVRKRTRIRFDKHHHAQQQQSGVHYH